MSDRLNGCRIIVTGAGGISAATAAKLVGRKACVHVMSDLAGTLDALREQVPGLTTSQADLSNDEAVDAAFDAAANAMGGIDGLVAVAGGSARRFGDGPVDALTVAALEASVRLNLATTTSVLRAFTARRLQEGPGWAPAVLTGSVLGRYPAPPYFVTHAYAAIKAGIEGLARSTAAHYASVGITVNVVAPGLVRTPMSTRAQENPSIVAYAQKRQPLAGGDGFIDADDVADACLYFLSAPTTTGQVLYVDGGWSVGSA